MKIKKSFIIWTVVICCLAIVFGLWYMHTHKTILTEEYVHIHIFDIMKCRSIDLDNKKDVDLFVKHINKMYKRETLEWQLVNKTPDVTMHLITKDGIEEELYVYGPYLQYYEGGAKQYAITDSFFDYLDSLEGWDL